MERAAADHHDRADRAGAAARGIGAGRADAERRRGGDRRAGGAVPELPRELMVELLQRLSLRSAEQGEAIVVEGEPGASMFVLVHGAVQVVRQLPGGEPRVMDEMEEGSIFGEIALLADVPRVASVIASEESLVLEVSRELLDEMSNRHKALPELLQRFYKERLLANL